MTTPSWHTNETSNIKYTLLIYYSTQLQQKEHTSKPITALPLTQIFTIFHWQIRLESSHDKTHPIIPVTNNLTVTLVLPSRLLTVKQDLAKTQTTQLTSVFHDRIPFVVCIFVPFSLSLFITSCLWFLRHDNTKCTKQPKIKTAIFISKTSREYFLH